MDHILNRLAISAYPCNGRRKWLPGLGLLLTALLAQGAVLAACTAANPNAALPENTPTSAFGDNGDGTLSHTLTGLTWDRCSWGQAWDGATCTGSASLHNWQAALAVPGMANDVTHRGQTDWRLPNRRELRSIAEQCGFDPAINQSMFPSTPSWPFWSASSDAGSPGSAWLVDFYLGNANANDKGDNFPVRLVRGGRSLDSFDLLASTVVVLNPELDKPLVSGKGFSGKVDGGYPGESTAGVYQFTATFCNANGNDLSAMFSRTRTISSHASLISRDRPLAPGNGGVDSEQDFVAAGNYADGILQAGECTDITYRLGLSKRKRFSFFVDILGSSDLPLEQVP